MRLTPLLALMTLAACEPSNEIDNPRFFRIVAEHHGPGGETIYEDVNARLRCTGWDCGSDAATACVCDGSYELIGSKGLSFKFHGTEGITRGVVSTDAGALIVRFGGVMGSGEATVSRARHLGFDFDDYALDLAGGFTAHVGPNVFVRGVFYSLPIDGE